jgi:hypothetical protein
VILTCLLNKKLVASIFTLIFWRTVCDLMISVGFIVMPQFQQFIRRQHCQDDDGSVACGDNDDWILDHQDKCLPMSLWLEFFQIASESWLLCITYDLVVTNYSTRSTLDRHFSFGRSRRGSEALLDVEIPPRGTLNDQPELSHASDLRSCLTPQMRDCK